MKPRGLERFRDHFRNHLDAYILIGGTACAVQFEQIGASFRTTKDFDVLVLADGDHAPFLRAMSDFLIAGSYQRHIDAQGHHRCFRFQEPRDETWPGKIEMCAKRAISGDATRQYFPLARPADGPEQLSLSAILFDDAYVTWLADGAQIQDDLSVAKLEFLLPLKALAWKNLTAAQADGKRVDGDDIRKHKLDCFRLVSNIPPSFRLALPPLIAADLRTFVEAMEAEQPGLPPELRQKPDVYLALMRQVFIEAD